MRLRALKHGLGFALAAASFASPAACAPSGTDAAPAIAWNHAFDAGLAEALRQNRPILVDFYVDW